MAGSIENLYPNRLANQNSMHEWQDANGNLYQFVADEVLETIKVLKNGVEVSAPFKRPVSAKTAAYTVLNKDCGTLFTTTGASGAVTFTLPTASAANAGVWFEFFNSVDQTMTIACATNDTLIVFNDVAADSIAFSTASEKIGGGVRVVSDGSKWLVFVALGAETQTPTIAT